MNRWNGIVLFVLLIPCCALAWYFVAYLPKYNAERLQLDRDRVQIQIDAAEVARKTAFREDALKRLAEYDKETKQRELDEARAGCLDKAAKDHDEELHRIGTLVPGHPQTYEGPAYKLDRINQQKKDDDNECYRLYPPAN